MARADAGSMLTDSDRDLSRHYLAPAHTHTLSKITQPRSLPLSHSPPLPMPGPHGQLLRLDCSCILLPMLRVLFAVSRIYPESPSTKIGLLPLRRLDPSTKVGLPPLRDWIPGILPGRLTLSGSRGNCGLCPHLASSLLYIFFLNVLLIVRSSLCFVRMIVFSPRCLSSCDAPFLCIYGGGAIFCMRVSESQP